MILFVSEKGLREDPNSPRQTFADILALSNVAYVKTTYTISCATRKGGCIHPNGFLRSHSDRILLAALRTDQEPSALLQAPGSHDRTRQAGMLDHASTLVQMQLKATDTTTGFSDKDIKSMTKLNFTISVIFTSSRDYSRTWRGRIDLSGVTTASSRRQLRPPVASVGSSRSAQQYLVLCAGVEHEDDINLNLLDFRSTRQQLEGGAAVFPACDFLKDRMGSGQRCREGGSPSASGGAAHDLDERDNQQTLSRTRSRTCSRRAPTASGRSSSITCGQAAPNMCCRWHQTASVSGLLPERFARRPYDRTNRGVRAWIEQCRARITRPSSDSTPPSKKTKLGPSASAYTTTFSSLSLPGGPLITRQPIANFTIDERQGTHRLSATRASRPMDP
ncbi:hypothetical protein MHU86_18833 [Fragilaria crotonensis]|nr:hypothetical protein MHU86_18833 [Fragilaria crotonensis]